MIQTQRKVKKSESKAQLTTVLRNGCVMTAAPSRYKPWNIYPTVINIHAKDTPPKNRNPRQVQQLPGTITTRGKGRKTRVGKKGVSKPWRRAETGENQGDEGEQGEAKGGRKDQKSKEDKKKGKHE